MASKAASVPREDELLCEHCGYGLDGLAGSSLCPECGRPVADSTTSDGRSDPTWEVPGPLLGRFWHTTGAVLISPSWFFRHIRTRSSSKPSLSFALFHHWVAAYLFALAGVTHTLTVTFNTSNWGATQVLFVTLGLGAAATPPLSTVILGIRWLAGKLSVLEARYHGMRLPEVAVTRALHYHSACLTPVAFLTALLPGTYRALQLFDLLPSGSYEMAYLYVLCGWVVLAAGYLFATYWMAMKSIMYANR